LPKSYDYSLKYFPVTYKAQGGSSPTAPNTDPSPRHSLIQLPLNIVSSVVMATGIPLKMIYPGSVKVLQALLGKSSYWN